MAVTTPPPRKYNPGFLTDDELVASFCVRTNELESIVEMLRECTGSSNPHQIVIGPRGSGKTSLLLRVAAGVRRDAGLSSAFFPVVFAEESYEVATAGEFWLECLSRLADQAPHREGGPDLHLTVEDLRTIRDDRTLAERCLATLLDYSDREGKRLVLMVENLNMMFGDMSDPDAGWRLRKVLQTEPRIVLLASATSRFDEIDHPDHALYDLFRTLTLRPLDTNECAILWETVSGRCPPPETVRSLQILTGGSPRLLAIAARFGGGLSFRELMADLLDLVDDHTEYFKSHLESLPAQERRVYLALADLWKPAFTKEVADRARLETSKCSAQLTRLVERGAVQVAGGTARRKQYYLSERLYNIYYLLRRNRRPDRLIEALIRFMAAYYSPTELKDIGIRIAREAGSVEAELRSLHHGAFARLIELPVLAGYREELLAIAPANFMQFLDRDPMHPGTTEMPKSGTPLDQRWAELFHDKEYDSAELVAAGKLLENAGILYAQNRVEDALAMYDELVLRFGESDVPIISELVALGFYVKGSILNQLDRQEEALTAYDEVVLRFDNKDAAIDELILPKDMPREEMDSWNELIALIADGYTPTSFMNIASALVFKGGILYELNRLEEALAAYDDVMRRFGESNMPTLVELIVTALVNKGLILVRLNQPKKALAAFDEVVRRFGESENPALLELAAKALVNKGITLRTLNRPEEALAAFDEVVRRFGESENPALLEQIAKAFVNKGSTLGTMNRPEEELAAYDEVVHRFGASDTLALLEQVAKALFLKGVTLGTMNRLEEALAAYDEVVRRFGASENPALLDPAVKALLCKGITLGTMNRPEEELAAYDEVVRRFGESETSDCRSWAELALLERASTELTLRQYGSAIETAGRVLEPRQTESQERRLRAHLIRARAILPSGDPSACEQDIEAILAILPEIGSLPKESLNALVFFSAALGPERMCELIKASPSAELLLPLTTALELELGLQPRVAREVEEVALDIRRDLAKARETVAAGSFDETAAEPKRQNV